jgi:outer membrane lipase/esterase
MPSTRLSRRPARTARLHLEALEERTLLAGGLVGNLVNFGDSLSDTGNVSLATSGAIPASPPYSDGRFSNGPIWVDTLAKYLGEPAVKPSLAGGLDYAFGGATAAVNPVAPFDLVPTLAEQVTYYLTGTPPNPFLPPLAPHTPAANDLFTVWAGANDFIDTFPALITAPPQTVGQAAVASAYASADAVASSLQTLYNAGARQFVVANMPPLGKTPYFQSLGLTTLGNVWAGAFNQELSTDLAALASNPGVKVVPVDAAGLLQQAIQNPTSFGFVNTTDPVGDYTDFPNSVFIKDVTATDSQDYLFFDGVHPTSKTQQIIGLQAAAGVYDALNVHHLVVTSTADTVDPTATGLSLREMLNLSNAMTGEQTITFNLGSGPHEIDLSGTDLPITSTLSNSGGTDVNILGPAGGTLTISGAGKSRVFEVGANAQATIANLTLTKGAATDHGGAISNAGQLWLAGDVLSGNTAPVGGAVYNTGALWVANSAFVGNTATGAAVAEGGALANSGPSATAVLVGTLFIDNVAHGTTFSEGGAIANLGGANLTVLASLLADNEAVGGQALGGAIFDDTGSTLDLFFSVVTNNMAQGSGTGGAGLGGGLYLAKGSKLTKVGTLIADNWASTAGWNVFTAT